MQNRHWRDQVRGDCTERPLVTPDEGRKYRTATEAIRWGENVDNGPWKEQVRGDNTEWPLERPGEGRHYRTGTGKTR